MSELRKRLGERVCLNPDPSAILAAMLRHDHDGSCFFGTVDGVNGDGNRLVVAVDDGSVYKCRPSSLHPIDDAFADKRQTPPKRLRNGFSRYEV